MYFNGTSMRRAPCTLSWTTIGVLIGSNVQKPNRAIEVAPGRPARILHPGHSDYAGRNHNILDRLVRQHEHRGPGCPRSPKTALILSLRGKPQTVPGSPRGTSSSLTQPFKPPYLRLIYRDMMCGVKKYFRGYTLGKRGGILANSRRGYKSAADFYPSVQVEQECTPG